MSTDPARPRIPALAYALVPFTHAEVHAKADAEEHIQTHVSMQGYAQDFETELCLLGCKRNRASTGAAEQGLFTNSVVGPASLDFDNRGPAPL